MDMCTKESDNEKSYGMWQLRKSIFFFHFFPCSLLLASLHLYGLLRMKRLCCRSIPMDKENQEEGKQVSKRSPSPHPEQADHNRAFAAALQQQQQHLQGARDITYTMLEMIESDESDEDEEVEDDDYSEGNFITGREYVDLMFYEEEEEEDSDTEEDEIEDEEEDDDDIDPDELTYEELLELGEIIGQESRGLSPEEISSTLSPYNSKSMQSKTSIDRCVICQVEYEEGEELVALRCEHPFHDLCINPWLQIKKVCPICSKEVIKQKTE